MTKGMSAVEWSDTLTLTLPNGNLDQAFQGCVRERAKAK